MDVTQLKEIWDEAGLAKSYALFRASYSRSESTVSKLVNNSNLLHRSRRGSILN